MDHGLRFMSLQEQQEYAQSLMHWMQLFRDGTLSDEFGEQIADLLERTAVDITEREWINCRWHVDDVLDVREDLTREQAKEVLHKVGGNHDAEIGINWDVIEAWADNLYPDPERGGLVAMLNGEHNDE